ncbi:MAG: hypothetical protein ACOYEE_01015 [Christensenellales bacterium]
MSKIRRNITVGRVFQVLFYALGFPLMVHLVLISSKPLMDNPLIGSGETQLFGTLNYYKGEGIWGVYLALGLWIVFILFQILFRLIIRENAWTRTAIATLMAAILFVGPIMAMDFVFKGKFEEERTQNIEATNVDVGSYAVNNQKYKDKSGEVGDAVDAFMKLYNLKEFNGKNYSGKNTDGSETVHNEDDAAWYSPNGMYADGYVFSVKQARKILRDYYENKYAFEEEHKNDPEPIITINQALKNAITALEADSGSDWNKYKNGDPESTFAMEGFEYIDSPQEYDLAYGDEGTAKKYFLSPAKLDAVLSVLGRELGDNDEVASLIGMLSTFGIDLGGINIAELLTENLKLADLITLVNGMGLGGTLRQLVDPSSTETTIDEAFIFSLLEGFSSYQSPTTYPVFYFIEDEGLKAYAYANYYAKVHGAKVGSVLVDDEGEDPRVGLITLDASGEPAPNGHEVLKELDWFDANEKMGKKYYPLFALRDRLVKWSAFCTLMIFAAYAMTIYIDEKYKKLTVKAGGK